MLIFLATFLTDSFVAPPPSPVEVIGPFIAWSPPNNYDGEISHYEVRVTSATGSFVTVMKNKMDTYHLLEREDVPTDLGGTTSIAIQVMYMCMSTSSESNLKTQFVSSLDPHLRCSF